MKHYSLKLLLQSGVKRFNYCSIHSLENFKKQIIEDYGDFIQLDVDEFEHPLLDKVYGMKKGETIEVKPFMVTYNIYKENNNSFQIDTTSDGWKTGSCNWYEFMLGVKSGSFNNINFK